MSGGRTVGIGSMVVDRYHRVPRILKGDEKGLLHAFPDGATTHTRVGGVVLNHLGWAAALGLPTAIFGQGADDSGGRLLRAAMARFGIARRLAPGGRATTTADIYLADDGASAIYITPGDTSDTHAAHIHEHHEALIQSAARVTTEVSQLPLDAVQAVLELARAAATPSVLDLDVPPESAVPRLGDARTLDAVLQLATHLKATASAARAFAADAADDALALARALRARFGNEVVVVTDGARGCAIASAAGALRVAAAPARKLVDVTGAGDAFLGGWLVALEAGLALPDAAKLACACGAACVEHFGALPDDPELARAAVLEHYDGPAFDKVEHAAAARDADTPASPTDDALKSFDTALEELAALRARLDHAAFARAVALILEAVGKGSRVHVTGIGKPEHIAHYAASLFASTGTPATFLHGTEAVHGSAGQVVAGDVVIAISNSGETALAESVAAVRTLGARIIAVTGDPASRLASCADVVLDAAVAREGGGLGLAPRASVAAQMLVLAALSAALESAQGFTRADYHARHPEGVLGQKSRDRSE